jgi:hypothetical protein
MVACLVAVQQPPLSSVKTFLQACSPPRLPSQAWEPWLPWLPPAPVQSRSVAFWCSLGLTAIRLLIIWIKPSPSQFLRPSLGLESMRPSALLVRCVAALRMLLDILLCNSFRDLHKGWSFSAFLPSYFFEVSKSPGLSEAIVTIQPSLQDSKIKQEGLQAFSVLLILFNTSTMDIFLFFVLLLLAMQAAWQLSMLAAFPSRSINLLPGCLPICPAKLVSSESVIIKRKLNLARALACWLARPLDPNPEAEHNPFYILCWLGSDQAAGRSGMSRPCERNRG